MKRLIHNLIILASILMAWSHGAQAQFTVATGTNFGPIPDAPGSGPRNYGEARDILFNVSGQTGSVTSVQVYFDADHSFVGDLRVTLIAPDGRSLTLFEHTGATNATSAGSSSNLSLFNRVIFDDVSTDNWWTGAVIGDNDIPSGFYRSVVAGGPGVTNPPTVTSINANFATASPNGQWILRFEDGWSGDTGEVDYAELVLGVPGQDHVVTNTADSGLGSLRDAMTSAQSGDRIVFESPLFDIEQTIVLLDRLPDVPDGVAIIGSGGKILGISRDGTQEPFRIFNIPSGRTATISDLNVLNGLEISERGGGIRNDGTLFLIDAMISFNESSTDGNLALSGGGGVYNSSSGTLVMTGCSLFMNTTTFIGGGLWNHNNGMARVSHSTFANNVADTGGGIGAVSFANTSGFTSLMSNTLVNNTSTSSFAGGLAIATQGPNATSLNVLRNNLFSNPGVFGNLSSNTFNGANPPNIISDGFNLSTDGGAGLLNQPTDRVGAVANVGPYGDYGGKTATVPLRAGSEAIDAGRATGFSSFDQRGTGFNRLVDLGQPNAEVSDGSDIGAFELQAEPQVEIFRNGFE